MDGALPVRPPSLPLLSLGNLVITPFRPMEKALPAAALLYM